MRRHLSFPKSNIECVYKMTISNLPTEFFCFEIVKAAKATEQQKSLFLKFHQAACERSGNNLKPTTAKDIEQSDFIATAYDPEGSIKAQCLLTKGDSDADKIKTYPPEAKRPDAFILTSLAGKIAIPTVLKGVEASAKDFGISAIFAKARATNQCAHEIFQNAGYGARGPETMGSDDYESYLYSRELLSAIIPPHVPVKTGVQAAAPV